MFLCDLKKYKYRHMKSFRIAIGPFKYNFNIDYQSKILFIGSCFTENIGKKLTDLKFKTDINPFGILYNPISDFNALNFIIENKKFSEEDLFYFNERWNSYYHHGKFSSRDKITTLNNINDRISKASKNIQDTNYLFITFGTAWIYELIETDQIVSNCHKVPNKNFRKKILSVDEIYNVYKDIVDKIKLFNKDIKIIFTISPVRHLKDGFEENFLSKSVLRVAIDKILKNTNSTFYFPAYEIMADDLRDYRFYNDDMVHPSNEAVEYIFDIFKQSFFNKETISVINKVNKFLKAKEHRPFNPMSNEFKQFKLSVLKEIEEFEEKYEYIDLDSEKSYFIK